MTTSDTIKLLKENNLYNQNIKIDYTCHDEEYGILTLEELFKNRYNCYMNIENDEKISKEKALNSIRGALNSNDYMFKDKVFSENELPYYFKQKEMINLFFKANEYNDFDLFKKAVDYFRKLFNEVNTYSWDEKYKEDFFLHAYYKPLLNEINEYAKKIKNNWENNLSDIIFYINYWAAH